MTYECNEIFGFLYGEVKQNIQALELFFGAIIHL